MYVSEKQYNDFGPKNLVLIVVVAVVLGSLAWSQRPIRTNAILYGTSLNGSLAADNSSPQVLGANEYNQALIDQFSSIEVATSSDNSQQAFLNYINQIVIVKNADKIDALLHDSAVQRDKTRQEKFIADLKRIAVPSALVDYQKLLLAYYQLRFQQQNSGGDQVAAYIVAVDGQLNKMRADYLTSAGVTLP